MGTITPRNGWKKPIEEVCPILIISLMQKNTTSRKECENVRKNACIIEKENQSRYEVLVENYNKINKIEALTAIEMVERDILPVVHRYIGELHHV